MSSFARVSLALLTGTVCAAALSSCTDTSKPTAVSTVPSPPPVPVSDLKDGANGGNAHFFFLPPLVRQPTYSGTPDATQLPEVTVCNLDISAADATKPTATSPCQTVVAKFSMTSGTASQVIRYDATNQLYIVNWQTDQCATATGGSAACALSTNNYYRITIRVRLAELGHVDIDPVSSASDLRNYNTGDAIPLINGRTMPVKFRIEQGAVAVVADGSPTKIGTSGGDVAASDGSVALVFPQGALSASTDVTVARASSYPPNADELITPYELGPTGTTFAQPVTLTLAYDPAKLPSGMTESDVRIWTAKGGGWELVPNSTVSATDHSVSAPLAHFSEYTADVAPAIYAYPNGPNQLAVPDVAGGQTVTARLPIVNAGGGQLNNLHFNGFFNYFTGPQYQWITAAFDTTTATSSPATATITITPPVGIEPGKYTIATSIAADGATTKSYVFSFMVTPAPVIAASPAGPNQVTIAVAAGGQAQTHVYIANAGGGTLSGLSTGGFFDYFNGGPYSWITGSFDHTTAPATLIFTASPPASYPPGTYSVATSIGAPGANTIPYYFTVTVTAVRTVAFQSDRDGQFALYSMKTDGTDLRRLTSSLEGTQPDWSPDGTRIAFVGGPCCNRHIYVMNADGSNVVQISGGGSDDVAPDWSPDGTRIVYSNAGIISVNADGSDYKILQYASPYDQLPKWSPDGRRIVFTSSRAGVAHVYVMNADGSNVQQLTNEPSSQEQNPSWSADGSKLVFERCVNGAGPVPWVCNTQWDLFVMNADGTNARNLTNTPNSDEWLGRFTADGRQIGFTTNRDGNNELYLMNADGSNPVNLTKNAARDVGLDFKP